MDKATWLNWRKIGSSDAPIIMQKSPWSTPYQLWEKRIMGKQEPISPAMLRGIEMEESARKCFEQKMGVSVFAKNLEHPKHNFMTASLDGIDMDGKIAVEIKCGGAKSYQFVEENKKVPDHYYPQVQHQMEVAGLKGMYFFAFNGSDGIILEVQKDEKFIEEMIEEEKKFWHCILEMEPPKLTERDYVNMEADKSWEIVAKEWKELEEKISELEAREKVLREQLIELAQDKNAQGQGVKLTRSLSRGLVDYDKIPELQSVNKELYRKKSFYKYRLSAI